MIGTVVIRSPHDGTIVGEHPRPPARDVDAALAAADDARTAWGRRPPAERRAVLRQVAVVLRARVAPLAALAVVEMAKPIRQARAEIEKCAACCDWYAETPGLLDDVAGPTIGDVVRLAPLGTLLAIMPWNYPYWQFVRVLVPALLLGNAVVLKPADQTIGCAHALHDALVAAGVPAALVPVLPLAHDAIPPVIAAPAIAAVTLTGSERAGRAVAAQAGAQGKPVVLELGGSDPFVVWHDADLAAAAQAATTSRCLNNGQSCIAAKRIIVHAEVHDAFVEAFVAAMRAQRVGDPRDEATDIGPLVSPPARDTVARQVAATRDAGARLLLGGVPDGPVGWCPPTVVAEIPDATPLADEECFAPVAALWRVVSFEAALARANATRFGLGASVWTRDPSTWSRFADGIVAGSVMANRVMASDPALPFGGVRASGVGRELGHAGLHAFANVQTLRGLV